MGNQSTCSCLSALIVFFASPSLALSLSASSSFSSSALSLHTLLGVREELAQKAEPRVWPGSVVPYHILGEYFKVEDQGMTGELKWQERERQRKTKRDRVA